MSDSSRIFYDTHIGIFDRRNLFRGDWALLALTIALAGIGLLNMFSATYGSASGEPESIGGLMGLLQGFFGRQFIYFIAGILIMLFIMCVDYRFLVSMAPFLYGSIIILLILVIYMGYTAKGAQRWLDIGFFRLQPSEFAKPVLVYMLTWYITRVGSRIQKIPYLVLAFIITAIPTLLIRLQPALSASLALASLVFVMLYFGGCKLWHIGGLIMVAMIPVIFVGMQVRDFQRLEGNPELFEQISYPFGLKLKPYQIQRILTFLEPERDPTDTGYHTIQARITVGSGEMRGKGFTRGTQTHLSFLPEYHTDFIFAVLAEEWGFLGSTAVVLLFMVFFLRAFWIAHLCTDAAGCLLVCGCTSILAFHAFVNIAITIGLLPATGMPLPFLSFGGSFYLTTMICVGTMLSVYVRRRFYTHQDTDHIPGLSAS